MDAERFLSRRKQGFETPTGRHGFQSGNRSSQRGCEASVIGKDLTRQVWWHLHNGTSRPSLGSGR